MYSIAHMSQRFFHDIANETSLSQKQVKKVMASIQKLTVESLKKGDNFKLPNYATVRLHKKVALPERERTLFGKRVTLKARAASSHIRISPVKKLKDQLTKHE